MKDRRLDRCSVRYRRASRAGSTAAHRSLSPPKRRSWRQTGPGRSRDRAASVYASNSGGRREWRQTPSVGFRADDGATPGRQRPAPAGAGHDHPAALHERLAQRALASDDLDLAWEHALQALRTSRSTDWSRRWAGGPVLSAVSILQKIDRARARPEIVRRFAELARDTDYFLGSAGGALDDLICALELPEVDIAREALGVARALLRDVTPLPSPEETRAGGLPMDESDPDSQAAFEELIVHLLGFEQTVAWEAARPAGAARRWRSLSSRMRRCRREISVQRPVRRRAC